MRRLCCESDHTLMANDFTNCTNSSLNSAIRLFGCAAADLDAGIASIHLKENLVFDADCVELFKTPAEDVRRTLAGIVAWPDIKGLDINGISFNVFLAF